MSAVRDELTESGGAGCCAAQLLSLVARGLEVGCWKEGCRPEKKCGNEQRLVKTNVQADQKTGTQVIQGIEGVVVFR